MKILKNLKIDNKNDRSNIIYGNSKYINIPTIRYHNLSLELEFSFSILLRRNKLGSTRLK